MFKHYFKIIIRSVLNNKFYTSINLIGLSCGIGASLILLLFIQHELSFDQFHEKKDQIYRIISIGKESGKMEAKTPLPLAQNLKKCFPEIKEICRVKKREFTVKKGEEFIVESKFIQTDAGFFKIFSFKAIAGKLDNALRNKNDIVLTESTAKKYFPDQNTIGQTIEIDYGDTIYKQQVIAVIEDFPTNSQIQADFIIPMEVIVWDTTKYHRLITNSLWEINDLMTYVLLPKKYTPKNFKKRLPEFISKQLPKDFLSGKEFSYTYDLQPLKKVHLFSAHLTNDFANKGNLNHIYLFGGIAILILLIAITNYIILSTARSLRRIKEIGLRKVVGANKSMIMKLVLGESIFISMLSLPIAVILVNTFLPNINELLNINIPMVYTPILLASLILIVLLIGLASGSYIAFYLSSYNPVDVFKSQANLGLKKSLFQKILITIQLMIFISLVISSGIIYRQVEFMKDNKVLGFEKENLLSVYADRQTFADKYESFKSDLLTNPDIKYVSTSETTGPAFHTSKVVAGFSTDKETGQKYVFIYTKTLPENTKEMFVYEDNMVDYDYIEALGLEIVAGRSFNKDYKNEELAVIVNEEYIKEFKVKNPLTEKFHWLDSDINIVGIVKNYHTNSLTEKILPVKLMMSTRYGDDRRFFNQIVVKLSGNNTKETLAFIEKKWKEVNPNAPFQYMFADTYIEQMYKTEMNLAKLIAAFALLAILITSLGLFGLSLSIVQYKTKEIVIRKTMGASIFNIVLKLINQFLGIILLANLIALPLTWYFMDHWLQNFEYQNMIDYRIFLTAAISSVLLCLLAVLFHSIKAAITNPIDVLKHE